MVGVGQLAQLEDGRDAEEVAEEASGAEGDKPRERAAREGRAAQLDEPEDVGRPRDEEERADHAEVPTRDVERSRDELAGGRGAADGGHPEERGHQHVRHVLDLQRKDAYVQRAGDLRRQRGAAAGQDGEHHRDGREGREVERERAGRDDSPDGDQRDDRKTDEHEPPIVGPRLLRVALDEQAQDAGDQERPAEVTEDASEVDRGVRQVERAQLLDVLLGHDAALAHHDLARQDLDLDRADRGARRGLRGQGRRGVRDLVRLHVLRDEGARDAALLVGPRRRPGLQHLLDRLGDLLLTQALGVDVLEGALHLAGDRLPIGGGHLDDVDRDGLGDGRLGEPRDPDDPLLAGERLVGPGGGYGGVRRRQLAGLGHGDGRFATVHGRHRSRGPLALGVGEGP